MTGVKFCKVFGTYPLAFCTGISLRDWILNYFSPTDSDQASSFFFFVVVVFRLGQLLASGQ